MEGGGLAFVVLLGLASLGLVIWSVVDAASRPDWAWLQSGQSKGLWIALPIVFLILCGIVGGILALVYLLSIRPQVIAVEQSSGGGPYGGGYGGPPGGYGAPPPGPYSSPPPAPQPPPPPSDDTPPAPPSGPSSPSGS